MPPCQLEAVGRGMAIRIGSAGREIRKLKYIFASFEGNGVIKNCQLDLERGRKLISITRYCLFNFYFYIRHTVVVVKLKP